MSLTPDDFPAFFKAVHGVPLFPWQARLLRDWVADPAKGWPAVLDLPTGSGKTAALDVAVFHLALEADKGAARRAACRIAFVVDRRLIVDEAYERAGKIAEALAAPGAEVVREVADRLGRLAERPERPLLARRLRGGVPREDDWARTPSQPTILCSTVDQVGSRLLFRGYGVGDRMRPVHAGLLGSDCLILLDEAHLAEPFRQTLAAIAGHRERWRTADFPPPPFGLALLTATPGESSEEPFALEPEDREHPILRARLEASKPARLIEISGKADEDGRVEELAALVAADKDDNKGALKSLRDQGIANPAIAVVINRVLRARKVFRQLEKTLGETADLKLVIGPARGIEREGLTAELTPIKTRLWEEDQDWTARLGRPLIIVATQTIEAGVDLDLDGLVTEAASLDALRQRFGRLNRAGRRGFTPWAAVVAHKDDIGKKADDPVYGPTIAAAWGQLLAWGGSERIVDFGIDALAEPLAALSGDDLKAVLAPRPDAPVMMPAYVDLWSQTWPVPAADPDVSLFLHGPDRSPANVQIVWRDDLELDRDDDALKALLSAMPPKPGETVEVSLGAARRWLREGAAERAPSQVDFSDAPQREPDAPMMETARPAFRWAGPDNKRTRIVYPNDLGPNDLIIAPASYGGCDQFGWDPDSEEPVVDVADRAAAPFRARRFALRLTRGRILAGVAEADESVQAQAERFAEAVAGLLADLIEPRQGMSATRLIAALAAADPPPAVRTALAWLVSSSRRGRPQALFPYGQDEEGHPRGLVLFAPRGIEAADGGREEGGAPATEDDDLGSADGSGLTLEQHSADVERTARCFAEKAGLPETLAADVALAGFLHDAGKADPRFQAWLYGGSWLAVDEARVLAKSMGSLPRDAWDKAKLPDRWRHEALSVRLAREHARFGEANDPELVLWLIGVHHGYGRPLFPHADEPAPDHLPNVLGGLKAAKEPGPQSLAFEFDGWDWPQMFERLKRRYGVWELARLEAIVRLADHRASEAAEAEAAKAEA